MVNADEKPINFNSMIKYSLNFPRGKLCAEIDRVGSRKKEFEAGTLGCYATTLSESSASSFNHEFDANRVALQLFLNMCWYILLVIGMWIVVSYLSYKNFLVNKKCSVSKEVLRKSNNVLFVVAHPDDECMFFGPTITAFTNPCSTETSLRKKAKSIYLLCLSNGNAHGMGKLRTGELSKSCQTLGIPDQNIIIHNQSPSFEDDPKKLWDPQLVADTIQLYVKKLKISSIVTFDETGVSGHLNHKALFLGAQQLKIYSSNKGDTVRVYVLESVNIVRKYSGFMDAIFIKPSTLVATADWQTRKLIQNAMAAHASQYVWFRRLYIIFSRYLFINTLLPLEVE